MCMLLMNIDRAFDTIYYNELINKVLHVISTLSPMHKIDNYLHYRNSIVAIKEKQIKIGLPQGGILSPRYTKIRVI